MIALRIAVPLDGDQVSQHFGHVTVFAIYDIDGDSISSRQIPSPGHEPGKLPVFLHGEGVSCVIAGGMGPRAVELFCDRGIDVIMGVSGSADDAVRAYRDGTLTHGESTCHHTGDESH